MHHPEIEPAHLRRVLVGSWFGIGAGLLVLVVLSGIAMTATSLEPGTELLPGVYDNLVIGSMLVLILACLMLQVWARLALDQRRLMAQIHVVRLQVLSMAEPVYQSAAGRATVVNGRREVDTVPAPAPPEDLQNGRVVELGTRIVKKISGV